MRTIKLSQGKLAIVDNDDYEWLNQWKWSYGSGGYAFRGLGTSSSPRIWMHREIMKTPKDKQTDHINGDGIDNRRCNLRVCTPSQNQANARRGGRFRGVYKRTNGKGYYTQISVRGRIRYIGCFDTREETAYAYNKAAIEYFGEFARLNN